MEIAYSKEALKILKRTEHKIQLRIREAINGLTETPPKGDIKPMEGKPTGRYRLRVGQYRVIYKFFEEGSRLMLFIIDIGTRGDIYK